ncbi:MAG: hypothetical protein OXN44_05860 [Acidimicrobiaceae bacterium]|nr:hypothetical protein [Acidimicrobiaceae bacterium]MDE0606037.1 hypothetical protein [Acidimicrobiaceae bacterium]
MSEVLEQVKSAAYASVGVNLLVTDAIVGREVPAPDFIEEHATLARKHATKALTDFRALTEPHAIRLTGQLPSSVAEKLTDNRNKAWEFIGIEAPSAAAKTTKANKRQTAKVKKPEAEDGEPKES